MGEASNAHELLEVLGNELRAIIGDDPWFVPWELFQGSLDNDLHIGFSHRLAQFVVSDKARTAIEHRAEVIKGSCHVDIGDVDVPVLVGCQRLNEAGPLLGELAIPCLNEPCGLEHAIGRRRTHGHNVSIQHHEGEPAVALQRELPGKLHDGLALPALNPVIARNPGVVLVGFPITSPPVVELGAGNAHPTHDPQGREPGALVTPLVDEINHVVSGVMRSPGLGQTSPRFFFKRTCSSMSSARASLRIASLLSRAWSLRSWCPTTREGDRLHSKAAVPFSKNVFCHW